MDNISVGVALNKSWSPWQTLLALVPSPIGLFSRKTEHAPSRRVHCPQRPSLPRAPMPPDACRDPDHSGNSLCASCGQHYFWKKKGASCHIAIQFSEAWAASCRACFCPRLVGARCADPTAAPAPLPSARKRPFAAAASGNPSAPHCPRRRRFRPCLVRKNFQDSPSNRIFGRMHGALNIDKNKN